MNAQDTRRVTVALAVLLASPAYVFCGLQHICMAGHMQHQPYPIWHYVLDSIWVGCFVTSAVLLWKSNLQLRKTIFWIIGLLFISRLVFGSGGGVLFLIELPLLIFLFTLAARSLLRRAPALTQVSNAERGSDRKLIRRRWGIALLCLGTTVFLIWGIPRCYWFFRGMLAPTIEVASVPFSKDVSLSPGAVRVIKLPNHKTVAVWCRRTSGLMAVLENSDLALEYGEAPFKRLEREEIALPDGASTGGEYLSYIRQGPVISSSDSCEYILYVDEYCVSLAKKPDVGQNLPVGISVRLASDKERIPKKEERAHFAS